MQRLRWVHESKYGTGCAATCHVQQRACVYFAPVPVYICGCACASEGTLAITPSSLSEANMPTDVTQLMQHFKYEIQRLAPQPEDITF